MSVLKPSRKSIIGEKFNKLTVLGVTKKRRNHMIVYKCKCECGNIRYATSNELKRNHITECVSCATKNKFKTLTEYRNKNNMHHFDRDGSNPLIIKKSRKNSNNTSGYKGVTWDKTQNKWKAQIVFKNKVIYLGRFENIEDAVEARLKAENELYQPYLDAFKKNF